jgi:hypothetical protein
MITFVCCPKPFNEHFAMIQNNAIQSWKRLSITRNIVIVGTDEGSQEYAETNQLIYFPNVKKNKWHTPLVDSIFTIGKEHTQDGDLVCYINSDIILLESFSKTIRAWIQAYPHKTEVLMVGLRWDWNNPSAIDFENENWENNVTELAKSDGRMHEHSGMDYFVHTKTTYPFIYPFAIGRYFWDWWLVGNCFRRGIMCIDISNTAFIIHQNCPWFQQGKIVTNRRQMYQTEEVIKNHSFDKFGRSIKDGTTYKSVLEDNGNVTFYPK